MWTKIKTLFGKLWFFVEKIHWGLIIKGNLNIYGFPFGMMLILMYLHPWNPFLWICFAWWVATVVINYPRKIEL